MYEARPTSPNISERSPYEGPITVADRAALAAVGCAWPESLGAEPQWLQYMNRLADNGSVDMKTVDDRQPIIDDRAEFIGHMGQLDATVATQRYDYLPTPRALLGLVRLMHGRGIDPVRALNAQSGMWHLEAGNVAEKLEMLDSRGINSTKAVNGHPDFLGFNTGTLIDKLHTLYTAARLAGFDDYRVRVHQVVEDSSYALQYTEAKTRLLMHIGLAAFTEDGARDAFNPSKLKPLYIMPAERQVAAYIAHGSTVHTATSLYGKAAKFNDYDRDELRGRIAAYANDLKVSDQQDPVIQAYLNAYPIDDEQSVVEKYEQRLRRRDRLAAENRKHPSDWQGPTMLGDPDARPSDAFAAVIDYPVLTEEAQAELERHIIDGDADQARRARIALAVRHLPVVMDIVDSCSSKGTDDRTGAANEALMEVISAYMSDEDEWKVGLTNAVVVGVMRVLSEDGPRYQERSLEQIETELGLEYISPRERKKRAAQEVTSHRADNQVHPADSAHMTDMQHALIAWANTATLENGGARFKMVSGLD